MIKNVHFIYKGSFMTKEGEEYYKGVCINCAQW